MTNTPLPRRFSATPLVLLICLLLPVQPAGARTAQADAAELPAGFDPARHMTIDEVEPGMRGYGLTVFHGTQPEPFSVEVISVERGFEAGKAVVWVRCDDPRMQETGPVQGMSGSPIYLWTDQGQDNPSRELGEGGRMLGAFAFGFTFGKDCYVGIQPIEQMLAAASRADADRPGRRAAGTGTRDQTFAALLEIGRQAGASDWRLEALAQVAGYRRGSDADRRAPGRDESGEQRPPGLLDGGALPGATLWNFDALERRAAARERASVHEGPPLPSAIRGGGGARSERLALPVMVGSGELASMLQPLFAPHGLAAQAGPIASSNLPPKWIDPEDAKLEPGGVFAVPLTFGPVELSAVGTTTEVLDDGTVLAFGHSFFGEGASALPMATGFVHFVQPRVNVSFKLGGSVAVKGAMVHDEFASVVGKPDAVFPTVPFDVHVRWPDAALDADYRYDLVDHEQLLPVMAGLVAGMSLTSDTTMPPINTLTIDAEIEFEGGRSIRLTRVAPEGSTMQVLMTLMPPLVTLAESEFASLAVERMEATIRVEDTIRAAQIVGATAQRSTVKPGEEIEVHLRMLPFREPERTRTVRIKVPEDTPDGRYTVAIGGARSYVQQRMALRPHLARARTADELFDAVREVLSVRDDALYTMLALAPTNNLAIGRSELPRLPSSRVAMLEVETSTRTSPFVHSVERAEEMPWVIMNHVTLPVNVEKRPQPGDRGRARR